jgi:hypothetical protein
MASNKRVSPEKPPCRILNALLECDGCGRSIDGLHSPPNTRGLFCDRCCVCTEAGREMMGRRWSVDYSAAPHAPLSLGVTNSNR